MATVTTVPPFLRSSEVEPAVERFDMVGEAPEARILASGPRLRHPRRRPSPRPHRPGWQSDTTPGSHTDPVPQIVRRVRRADVPPNAGTALPVGDPAGGSLDLKSDTSLLGLVNTVVK